MRGGSGVVGVFRVSEWECVGGGGGGGGGRELTYWCTSRCFQGLCEPPPSLESRLPKRKLGSLPENPLQKYIWTQIFNLRILIYSMFSCTHSDVAKNDPILWLLGPSKNEGFQGKLHILMFQDPTTKNHIHMLGTIK